jgi:putative transposase
MLGVKKGFTNKHFWSRGYCVSTAGLDEQKVSAYVRNQEDLDRQESLDFDE